MNRNHQQVRAMLLEALADAEREGGGVGVEIHLLTAAGVTLYRWFNADATDATAEFAAMPVEGRVQ